MGPCSDEHGNAPRCIVLQVTSCGTIFERVEKLREWRRTLGIENAHKYCIVKEFAWCPGIGDHLAARGPFAADLVSTGLDHTTITLD